MRYVTIIGGKCANLCVYKCDYACQEKRGSQSVPVQIKPFVTVRTGPGVSMRNGRKKEMNRGGELERVRVQQGERKRETEIESESERAQRLSCLVLLWLCQPH